MMRMQLFGKEARIKDATGHSREWWEEEQKVSINGTTACADEEKDRTNLKVLDLRDVNKAVASQ